MIYIPHDLFTKKQSCGSAVCIGSARISFVNSRTYFVPFEAPGSNDWISMRVGSSLEVTEGLVKRD